MDAKLRYASAFLKHYKKRITPSVALQKKVQERMIMLTINPRHPLLHDHPLKGDQSGRRSFSITGDIRVIYRIVDETIELLDIGTHNQVYTQ